MTRLFIYMRMRSKIGFLWRCGIPLQHKRDNEFRDACAEILRHAGGQYRPGRLSGGVPALLLAFGRAPEPEPRRLRGLQEGGARWKLLD